MLKLSWKIILIGPVILTLISGIIPYNDLYKVYETSFGVGYPFHFWMFTMSDDVGIGIDQTNFFDLFWFSIDIIFWFIVLLLLKFIVFIASMVKKNYLLISNKHL